MLDLLRRIPSSEFLGLHVDLREVGAVGDLSPGASESELLAQATRLVVDVLAHIHTAARRKITEYEAMDEETALLLDALAVAISRVRLAGPEERSVRTELEQDSHRGTGVGIEADTSAGLGVKASFEGAENAREAASTAVTQRGHADVWLHLGSVAEALSGLADRHRRMLVLVDEWQSVPMPLQPWLADLFRRLLWDTPGCIVKIAAVREESRFQENIGDGVIGLNPYALNSLHLEWLEDADIYRDAKFVARLLFDHASRAALSPAARRDLPADLDAFEKAAFRGEALSILAEACEGNPRDALVLAASAASLAGDTSISEAEVLRATQTLLLEHKNLSGISPELLQWLTTDVCRDRSSRVFYASRSLDGVPPLLRSPHNARLVHKGRGMLKDTDPASLEEAFEEWRIDFSLAAYLAGAERGIPVRPQEARAYESLQGAPRLSEEQFSSTTTWRIGPSRQVPFPTTANSAWADGPPPWVDPLVRSLEPDADYLIVDAGAVVETIPLKDPPIFIGRSQGRIRILDPGISRLHAMLQKIGDTWRIVDKESRNGIVFEGSLRSSHDFVSGDWVFLSGVVLFYVRPTASD